MYSGASHENWRYYPARPTSERVSSQVKPFLWAENMVNKAYVYVMSNDSLPNIYKVGYTVDLDRMVSQLSRSTAIPKEFKLIYCGIFQNAHLIERHLHKKLLKYSYGKEFFKLTKRQLIYKLCNEFHNKELMAETIYKTNYFDQIVSDINHG